MSDNLTPLGSDLLITSLKAQRDRVQRERDDAFTLLAAMVAGAGERGITVPADWVTRKYEITRTENLESLTFTFTAKEVE